MKDSLAEITNDWSLADLQDAHATLDLIEDEQARAALEAPMR
jgi:hypothetical protein